MLKKYLLLLDQTILLHLRSSIDRPLNLHQYPGSNQGRIQDFKLGGAQLKKMRRAEKSRFYAKKADYRISLLPLTSNSKNKTVVSKLHCMSNL